MTLNNQPRRIVYVDDGAVVKHMPTTVIEDVLRQRLEHLVGVPDVSYFYCGQDNFGQAFHKSNVEGVEISGNQNLRDVLNSGTYDPSEEHIKFCKREGIEVFWKFLMNDVQDHPYDEHTTEEERLAQLSQHKRTHLDWLLGNIGMDFPYESVQKSIWSAWNYAIPEVTSFVYECIQEVVEKYAKDNNANGYGIDGLEFDYCRNASLFVPTFEQRPVEADHLDKLTLLQIRLRELAQRIASERGRPLLLAAAVPETLSLCRYVGIDLERWLADQLIDIVIVGNGYVPFTDHIREIIDLCHRRGVLVYPRLSCTADLSIFKHSREALRAIASNFSHLGGDGLYLFNFADDPNVPQQVVPYDVLEELSSGFGDPQLLSRENMLFCADTNREAWRYGGDIRYYMPLDGTLPLAFSHSGGAAKFYLGTMLPLANNPSEVPAYSLCVRIDGSSRDSAPPLLLNGRTLPDGELDPTLKTKYDQIEEAPEGVSMRWFRFALARDYLRAGVNILEDCEDRIVNNVGSPGSPGIKYDLHNPEDLATLKDINAARLARVYLEVDCGAAAAS